MIFSKKMFPVLMGLFLLCGTAAAQGQQMQNQKAKEVTDAELKHFVTATNSIRDIQMDAQKEVEDIVQKEGMKFQRFQTIMMSKQNPKMAQNLKVTDEENKVIEKIQPELQKINQDIQQKFMTTIQNNELTPQRYQQIAMAVRTDSNLSKKFQSMIADTSGKG